MENSLKISLFKKLFLIRKAELELAKVYKEQIIKTPAHFGLGQEAIAVGVCAALNPNDAVYSHHRCHNHYLAQGGDLYRMIAELMGKEDGCSKGRGGSVHLTDRSVGFIASSAILGQSVAVAAGSALSFKMDGKDNVGVSFLGDATPEEGAFWETLNYSAINKLPLLIVCENNGYSTETLPYMRQPQGTTIADRVRSFNIRSAVVDGNDVEEVNRVAIDAINYCREGNGPVFMECHTYRWLEHVGPYFDHEMRRSYRSKEELDEWMEKDPVLVYRKKLISEKVSSEEDLAFFEDEIDKQVSECISRARAAAWPVKETLFDNVYG